MVARLTGGLDQLAKQRKVQVVRGTGRFVSANHLEVGDGGTRQIVAFRQCIIAAGSESARIPGLPDDPRIIDSTAALELELPETLLVIGGGIIGLEMATVYDALGVRVSVVELLDQLMPGVDADLLRPLERRIRKRYEAIMTGTKVSGLKATDAGIEATLREGGQDRDQDLRQGAGGGRPHAERPPDRRRQGRRDGRRAGLHPGRQADAHQRAAHLRDRRHRRPADARAQGESRRQGGRGSGGRDRSARSMRA